MNDQQYCISARCRYSGYTDAITGPMSKEVADKFQASTIQRNNYKYFRISKYPFKRHKKS